MERSGCKRALCGLPLALAGSASAARQFTSGVPVVRWEKVVLDRSFRSEGVAVADVDRDGEPDVLAGEFWYLAPHWKRFELAPPGTYDPATGYSACFSAFARDVDRDGWIDLVVVGFPGDPCAWYENPGNPGVHWQRHVIWPSACNESPAFHDVDGDGARDLVIGSQPEQRLLWLEPGPSPQSTWIARPISLPGQPGAAQFDHGLGFGDVDRDGRADALTASGWYRAPPDPQTSAEWPFTAVDWHATSAHGPQPAAQMHVLDADGDGRADVVTSSPHAYGLWWWRRTPVGAYEQRLITDSYSQAHALAAGDVDGDGLTDLVSGKRWYAHGPSGDPGSQHPVVLEWYQLRRQGGTAVFARHAIDPDADSGVGTQFELHDVDGDGRLDVVVSNKKGVAIHYQRR